MSSQANSAIRRLVERDKDTFPPPSSPSQVPEPSEAADAVAPVAASVELSEDDNIYDGLNWERVPELERRQTERQRGLPSWIYRYGWPVWHRKKQRNYWLCFYCHKHRYPGGVFDVSTSTSSAGSHMKQLTRGHGFDAEGLIVRKASAEGTIIRAVGRSVVEKMRDKSVVVSQEVANELAGSLPVSSFKTRSRTGYKLITRACALLRRLSFAV